MATSNKKTETVTIESLEMQVKALQEKLDILTNRFAHVGAAFMGGLHKPPVFLPKDGPVETPKLALVSSNGVRVGDKAWVAYTEGGEDDPPRVLSAKVTAVRSRDDEADVIFDVDESEATEPLSATFPFSPEGKKAAQKIIDAVEAEQAVDQRRKAAAQAEMFIYAMEGELGVKALLELKNRQFVALASLCGLTNFRELKGLAPELRAKKVAVACRKLRTAPGGSKPLKAAKAAVAAWEVEAAAIAESETKAAVATEGELRGKAKALRVADEAANGRSMLTSASRPGTPAVGDMVVDGKDWYRVLSVVPGTTKGGVKLITKHMASDSPATFTDAEFWKNSAKKNTPIWKGVRAGKAAE